jgi:hypothetical protein
MNFSGCVCVLFWPVGCFVVFIGLNEYWILNLLLFNFFGEILVFTVLMINDSIDYVIREF